MTDHRAAVRTLLERGGRTFSDEAGFILADRPSPLWQLLVLAMLVAKPIRATMATDAAAELRKAGCTTPKGTLGLTWQQRVDALVRAHYTRFDESTATRTAEAAEFVLDRYRGDLRRLGEAADGDADRAAELLEEVPGLGPAGAAVFLREAQAVWPWLRPYLDERARDGAKKVGLPSSVDALAGLVGADDLPRLAAALVRCTLDDALAAVVKAA